MKETELARSIVDRLLEEKWDVYQEVMCPKSRKRADIVATSGSMTWVIECKVSLSIKLIEQAEYWVGRANMVSVCVPKIAGSYGRFLDYLGIGVCLGGEIVSRPRFFRRTCTDLRTILCEEQKTWLAAGSQKGRYFTDFQRTCNAIHGYVHEHPGCYVDECLRSIEHHYHCYSTARQCLGRWLSEGKVYGVRIDKSGKRHRLFVT